MSAPKDPGRHLSISEAEAAFEALNYATPRSTILRWIKDGTLEAYRPGPRKHVRIPLQAVMDVAKRRAAR